MSPMLRSATAAASRAMQSRRILHRRPFSNSSGQENTKPADMQLNVLLEELQQTRIGSVTDDTMVKFLRSCRMAREQILRQNVGRSWQAGVLIIAGYTWGCSRVPRRSALSGDEVKEYS